jgi:hypothetical protein
MAPRAGARSRSWTLIGIILVGLGALAMGTNAAKRE